MAGISRRGTRLNGVLVLLYATCLSALGLYLAHVALNWSLPRWLPADLKVVPGGAPQALPHLGDSALGLAAGYLLLFGAITGLHGLWMLGRGRRNAVLRALVMVFFLIFLGSALYLVLNGEPWKALKA